MIHAFAEKEERKPEKNSFDLYKRKKRGNR